MVNPEGCADHMVYAAYHQDEPSNTLRFFVDRHTADGYIQYLRQLTPGNQPEPYNYGYQTLDELKQSTKQLWE